MTILNKLAEDFPKAKFQLLNEGMVLVIDDQIVKHNWINNELFNFDDLAESVQKAVYNDIYQIVSTIVTEKVEAVQKVKEDAKEAKKKSKENSEALVEEATQPDQLPS